ncbi:MULTISPECIES: FliM/FliN family flagellar motor switch protein [Methylobacterium]|jgi:flagellar motor switch protein FliM|uniref:Flagellar motor switch protein FliM n=2 Tax=Methylobacterium TaxID=407 RepID=A0AAE8HMQ6_9HYPH|nr:MULTISPECIES: FliM/FliN family flagellar motor switch protein [Methylobacterium]APT30631.1 flagellar motor switch protein FliM [Methylobacterium phyllosphaerae]MBA9063344.1 flagellar motor switch protein FliM [Methylobacterium fujisawaense]MBP29969.1 flagellar motor switch protein FliM [Methylobacterium sp.]MDH3027853.1 FliM/FliN family flagellar motor switch protein [Methylobacterium fujisawaense]RUP12717.1 MAG: flagellar motor switch protein FliM [Methylobacterium sp.]
MDKQPVANDIRDRLLDAAGLSLDRLPMLHVILDRAATFCAEQLRHLAASPVYFSLSNVESQRFGDILEPYEANAVAGIFKAPEWDSHILVGFDRDFIFTMVEALLGADGSEPPLDEERSFSNIEMRIAQRLFEQIGKAMQSAFALVADTPFKLERTELRMDFAVIGRRNNQAVAAKFVLQALNRGGEMFIVIPQSVLNPMRQSLARILVGETSARDSRWTKQIAGEVQKTPVTLKAILEEKQLTLGEIAELSVGQVLELRATPRSRVKLVGNDRDLFWCDVGQEEGGVVLRVDRFIDQDQEFIDDVLSR